MIFHADAVHPPGGTWRVLDSDLAHSENHCQPAAEGFRQAGQKQVPGESLPNNREREETMKLNQYLKSIVSGTLVLSLILLLIPLVVRTHGEDAVTPPESKPSQLAKDLIGTWIIAGTPDNVEEPPATGAR